MKNWKTNRRINPINWLLPATLLLLGAAWLCQPQTTATAQRGLPTLPPGQEQSFAAPQTWAQALTTGQGWDPEYPRMLADVDGDQRQDVVGFGKDGVWLATSTGQSFSPAFVLADFGYRSGWRVAKHPRVTGDINGDGLDDLVGFGDAGVSRALSTGSGFGQATFVLADFGENQGWRVDRHVRLLADVNGDGKKDIVAFGDAGVWLALATSSGHFAAPQLVVAEFGYNQGWTPTHHPRMTADINGDGRQDIVGFANDGVWIAISTGAGFEPAQKVLGEFGFATGSWQVDRHPRLLTDINGDGKQDIVGFGDDGVWIAHSTGNSFAAARLMLNGFGYNHGWRVGTHPRFVADLNGDGYQDIVGFGNEAIYRSLGGPNGFTPLRDTLHELVFERGFPWNSTPDVLAAAYPRLVGDTDGDGKHDLIAFDQTNIKVVRSLDVLTSSPNQDVLPHQVFVGRESGTALATLPATTLNSVVIPPTGQDTGRGPTDRCSPQKIAEIRAQATASASEAFIDCSLSFDHTDSRPITKRLIFEGDSADGVTLDCNQARLDGGSGSFNAGRDMIEIRSLLDGSSYRRPNGVTIRNCNITGSIRIFGMGKNGEATAVRDSSRQDAGHITRLRNAAPTRITLDHLIISGTGRTPLYLSPGVTYVTLTNSEIKGDATRTAIYLDAESGYNTIKDNYIHVDIFDEWPGGKNRIGPQVSIDTSSHNMILNNYFSGLTGGGIFTFRNCGEGGTVRHGSPTHNHIINNVFYYNKSDGDVPSVLLGSRGQWYYDFPWWTHCDDDEGYPWGSSVSNEDYSKYNVVMQNQVFKLPVNDVILRDPVTGMVIGVKRGMIRAGHPETDTPNYINYNETVTAKIERKAGCYISNGYPKDFILDGEFINLFPNANGDLVSTGYRLTCNDGVLNSSSDPTSRPVSYLDFDCQASGNNNGCQKTAFVPTGKTLVGAKAACNLEFGTVSATDLNGVSANFVKVLRASDNVSEGSCTLGGTSIRSGQAAVSGLNGLTRLSFGCREKDANGGDCHIKGRLYFQ